MTVMETLLLVAPVAAVLVAAWALHSGLPEPVTPCRDELLADLHDRLQRNNAVFEWIRAGWDRNDALARWADDGGPQP